MMARVVLALALLVAQTVVAFQLPVAPTQMALLRRSFAPVMEVPEPEPDAVAVGDADAEVAAEASPTSAPAEPPRSIFDPETTVGGVTIPLPPIVCTAIVSFGFVGLVELTKLITPAWESVRASL